MHDFVEIFLITQLNMLNIVMIFSQLESYLMLMGFQQHNIILILIENLPLNISKFLVVLSFFKQYETYEKGKVIKNKYTQQGTREFFIGVPDDSAGWLFYVHDSKKMYIWMDTVFDEQFTTPLCLPDLQYQWVIRLQNIKSLQTQ